MDNYDYKLIILGEPKAQQRHRTASKDRGGKPLPFVMRYDPSKKDKMFIRALGLKHAPKVPLDCPILVDVYWYFRRPKNHYRTGKFSGQLKPNAPTWCSVGIDRDNADKLILDALTGVFWINDSRVCDGRIVKQYSENPRTEILVKILTEPGQGPLFDDVSQKDNSDRPSEIYI